MRFASFAFLAASLATSVTAFTFSSPNGNRNQMLAASNSIAFRPRINNSLSMSSATMADQDQTTPPENNDYNTQIRIPASKIRSAQLTTVDGETITLGDKMGSGTSLVMFLRHMG